MKCNSFVNVLYLLWLLSPFLNCHVSRCTFSHRLLGVMLTDTTRILFYSGFCTDWTLKVCVLQLYCKQLLLESLGWFDENTSFEISKFCSLFSYQASHPFFQISDRIALKMCFDVRCHSVNTCWIIQPNKSLPSSTQKTLPSSSLLTVYFVFI